jgi:predicted ATPase
LPLASAANTSAASQIILTQNLCTVAVRIAGYSADMKHNEYNPSDLLETLMQPRPEVVSVSGGPAGGKTMTMRELDAIAPTSDRPIRTVPEVPTMWMEEHGISLGALAQTDRDAYLDAQVEILQRKIAYKEQHLEELAGTDGLIATDRGTGDDGAYMTHDELIQVAHRVGTTPQGLVHDNADKVVFLRSLAVTYPDVYERECGNNGTRYENVDEARSTDERTLRQWRHHPELHIVDGAEIPRKLSDALGFILSNETEIEERWEVTPEAAADFVERARESGDHLNTLRFRQTYHQLDGVDYRLRHGLGRDGYDFYHFAIKEPTEHGNVEVSRRLTADEYHALLSGEQEGALQKVRHVVLNGSQIWHCDSVWDTQQNKERWFFEAEAPSVEALAGVSLPLPLDMYHSDYNTRTFACNNGTMMS